MSQSYIPNDTVLQKYARLLVRFGLQTRAGKPIAKGSVVLFEVPDVAKSFYFHLQNEILAAGYQPMGRLLPTDDEQYNLSEAFYTQAKKSQREFFPEAYTRGVMQQIDGRIAVLAKTHPDPLKNVAPKVLMEAAEAKKLGKELFFEKVNAGKLAWTLAFYGTAQAAADAGMSERAYWNQIIKACYLDHEDPVAEWKKINRTVQKTAQKLSQLKIDQVQVLGPDVDLTIGIGANRAWRAGGGNNVPSYEVFTSPDYRRVNGWIRFNQPLYDRYGNLITDIRLEFRDGVCVRSSATKNEAALKQLLRTPGGNRLGEFSLTDASLSRITKFMANTLYDENVGGKYGNTHVAIGSAYRDCYQGSKTPKTDADWDALGYNDSVVHEDMVSTSKRTVTATLADGTQTVIYQDGHFTV